MPSGGAEILCSGEIRLISIDQEVSM
jgi:hypothetical protein